MIEFLRLILHIMASLFKPRTKLVAEILVLRQQLNVLRRQVSKRPHLSIPIAFCLFGSIVFPCVLSAIAILRPETIIRRHRAGFQSYWRGRSRKPVGRPRISAELRNIIGAMSRANHLWGVQAHTILAVRLHRQRMYYYRLLLSANDDCDRRSRCERAVADSFWKRTARSDFLHRPRRLV
jgi:hypothetical protein